VQAGALLAQVGADARPRDVWLAHLSQHTNSPQIAIRAVQTTLHMAGVDMLRLAALPRRQPQHWSSDSLLLQQELFADW
jgi:hypothetical protein